MSKSRDLFLQQVKEAVLKGNRSGVAASIEPRGTIGEQTIGRDRIEHFRRELEGAGGNFYPVPDTEAAITRIIELIGLKKCRRALIGGGSLINKLNLTERLRSLKITTTVAGSQTPDRWKDQFFDADIGITGVDFLIAESGTVATLAQPTETRSVSLLPPVHVAVAEEKQLLDDLFELMHPAVLEVRGLLPSCISLITGPSKTGDIELRLVRGVHGPGEIHVILISKPMH